MIEEWCEGVIQDNREIQGEFSSSNKSELEKSQSLLLEKIAAHLLKRVADILAIDVQGLTKVPINSSVSICHKPVSTLAQFIATFLFVEIPAILSFQHALKYCVNFMLVPLNLDWNSLIMI